MISKGLHGFRAWHALAGLSWRAHIISTNGRHPTCTCHLYNCLDCRYVLCGRHVFHENKGGPCLTALFRPRSCIAVITSNCGHASQSWFFKERCLVDDFLWAMLPVVMLHYVHVERHCIAALYSLIQPSKGPLIQMEQEARDKGSAAFRSDGIPLWLSLYGSAAPLAY